MKKSVLGIGNALVDILTKVDNDNILNELNLPKGSMQLVDAVTSAKVGKAVERFENSMSPGGSAANTIHGIAKCGIPAGFIFSTGNDEIGKFFEDAMREVGVKPICFHSNTPSGTARAIISPDGERTFATHLGAAVELSAEVLKKELFEGWDYCYIEGYLIANQQLVRKTIELAKQADCKIAIDLASYNVVEANRDFLLEIMPQIDIVFANEEEAKSLTNSTPEESLEFIAKNCEIAVVKIGKRGSLIKRGDEKVQIGCNKVNVIDTTGAGDMYAAGFLAGLINGLNLEKCGELGSCLAENIIQVIGAKMGEDRWGDIRRQFPMI
ncbi:MAG: adenosine kinase [Bacteroidia bacterium]|nr:adenosine kinase [Bacteroidia bacterium]